MYEAIISTLCNVRKHSNADRLVLADVNTGSGEGIATVVVGLDSKDNDKGIYFPADLQLSERFADANDLVARFDENNKKIGGGFFDKTRRVRAQSFRGVKSQGFWMPISSLYYVDTNERVNSLTVGTTMSEYVRADGEVFPLCKRYFTDKQMAERAKIEKEHIQEKTFPMHADTKNIMLYSRNLFAGDRIVITAKLHGTSHRVANLPKPLHPFKAWWNKFLHRVYTWKAEYHIQHGSRRVLINANDNGFYGTNEFRYKAVRPFANSIPEGAILYGEIVGYVGKTELIMPPHDVPKGMIADFDQPKMYYTYGRAPDSQKFYLYHMKMIDPSGKVRDLRYEEIADFAYENGIATPYILEAFIYDGDEKALISRIKSLGESLGMSIYDNTHLEEGIAIRVERGDEVFFYKYKATAFCILEGIRPYETREETS